MNEYRGTALPSKDYLRAWDERIVTLKRENTRLAVALEESQTECRRLTDSITTQTRDLYEENIKLRAALAASRSVLTTLKNISSSGMHRGFDMWIAKIDEALKWKHRQ